MLAATPTTNCSQHRLRHAPAAMPQQLPGCYRAPRTHSLHVHAVAANNQQPKTVPGAAQRKVTSLVRALVKERAATSTSGNKESPGPLTPDETVELPPLKPTHLNTVTAKELASVITQSPPRAAKAHIFYPTNTASTTSENTAKTPIVKARGAVVFAHAFVQPSTSYVSVIKELQSAGWLVVAPTTDLFDVVGRDVGVKFDQKRADIKLQSTLQSALIIDVLRSHQMLLDDTEFEGDIVFVGHSLGGACAVIAAAKVQYDKIKGVAVMSPEVREMQKTPVNDDIWLLNGNDKSVKAAYAFFEKEFPKETALALISSRRDNIARPEDLKRLFVVATESRKGEDVALFHVAGNHLGYEQELDLPQPVDFTGAAVKLGPFDLPLDSFGPPLTGVIRFVNRTVVPLFERLQYQTYNAFTELLLGNSPQQEPHTLAVLKSSLEAMVADKPLANVAVAASGVGIEAQPSASDIDRVLTQEPLGNTKPVLWIDALLLLYAGAQALNAVTAFNLLQDGSGDFETRLGLLILGSLSASLTYENSLLVLGRFFDSYEGGIELLQELSKWRFLAHSAAPLALVAGLNIAGRAGVEWAANPVYEGLVGLLILAVVGVSSIRNSLFLELTPVWNKGILRFSFAQGSADLTRVIPVIVTTLVLVVLGWQSYSKDATLLPFFVGPLAAFILNAVPSGKDGQVGAKLPPQFVLGNGGEVLLFGSMVLAEVLLRMQGK